MRTWFPIFVVIALLLNIAAMVGMSKAKQPVKAWLSAIAALWMLTLLVLLLSGRE